jgi:hypothetical protein
LVFHHDREDVFADVQVSVVRQVNDEATLVRFDLFDDPDEAVGAPSESVLVVFEFPAHRKAVNSVQDVAERRENRFVETEKSGLPGLEVPLEVADVVAFLGRGVHKAYADCVVGLDGGRALRGILHPFFVLVFWN